MAWKIPIRRSGALILVTSLLGCGGGPSLPRELTFEGAPLEKARGWSSGGVSGVVFVPPGQKLPAASLQVGVVVSRDHTSAADLHRWIMEQYHRSAASLGHVSDAADEACKVNVTGDPRGSMRPFVAFHVCRAGEGFAACAEVDEQIEQEAFNRCLHRGYDCWDALCTMRGAGRRASLESILGTLGAR